MSWRELAQRSAVYPIWRRIREQQQVHVHARLVAQLAASARPYDESGTRAALAARRMQRRKIDLQKKPRVLGFGVQNWERFGLWQAFEAECRFELFEYGAHDFASPYDVSRRRMGKLVLDHADRLAAAGDAVDVVFMYAAGFYIDPEMIAELHSRGIWTVLMALDDKQQLPGPRLGELEGWQLEAARSVDLYWTTWRTGADLLAGAGARPWYAAPGADPSFFRPVDVERDLDVVWVGRAYGTRRELIDRLRRRGLPVSAFGPSWPGGPLEFDRMIETFSRARIVLGMGGVGQTDRIKHVKGRDIEVPMCGAAYLTSFNPELTDFFEIGREILCYASSDECEDVLRWALARPDICRRIGEAARLRCMRDHTWSARVSALLGLLRN